MGRWRQEKRQHSDHWRWRRAGTERNTDKLSMCEWQAAIEPGQHGQASLPAAITCMVRWVAEASTVSCVSASSSDWHILCLHPLPTAPPQPAHSIRRSPTHLVDFGHQGRQLSGHGIQAPQRRPARGARTKHGLRRRAEQGSGPGVRRYLLCYGRPAAPRAHQRVCPTSSSAWHGIGIPARPPAHPPGCAHRPPPGRRP